MQVNDLEYLSTLSQSELIEFFRIYAGYIKEECLVERLIVIINGKKHIF